MSRKAIKSVAPLEGDLYECHVCHEHLPLGDGLLEHLRECASKAVAVRGIR